LSVRQAFASFIATLLHLSQSPPPNKLNSTSSISFQPTAGAAAETNTNVNSELRMILTPSEMMNVISNQLVKSTVSRQAKVALFETYHLLFKFLTAEYLQREFAIISNSLIELSGDLKIISNGWNEVCFFREACGFLLRSCCKMCSEGGQLSALLELNNNWLRKWTNPLPEPTTTAPNKYIITCVLNEMSALLIDLGSATAPAQDQLLDTLMILLSHSSESVNVSLCWTLKCMCFSLPDLIAKIMKNLAQQVQRHANLLINSGNNSDGDLIKKFLFNGNALASIVTVIPHRNLHVSFE
jgi:hypothetical protein